MFSNRRPKAGTLSCRVECPKTVKPLYTGLSSCRVELLKKAKPLYTRPPSCREELPKTAKPLYTSSSSCRGELSKRAKPLYTRPPSCRGELPKTARPLYIGSQSCRVIPRSLQNKHDFPDTRRNKVERRLNRRWRRDYESGAAFGGVFKLPAGGWHLIL